MSSECQEKANSTLRCFGYSDNDFVDSSRNIKTEDSVDKIKQEPTDYLDNTKSNIEGRFELPLLVKVETEQNDITSAIELDVEAKIEIEEPEDYNNLVEIPLNRTISQNQRRQKTPETKRRDTIKSELLFFCAKCKYRTKLMRDLMTHNTRMHLKQKINLQDHKSDFQKCKYCQFVGATQEILLAHRVANHSIHKCRFCGYTTKHKGRIDAHENAVHLKKDRYSCVDCNFTTLYKNKMVMHAKKHTKIDFECDKCDYKTKFQWRLKMHINSIHTKSELVYCAHCDYTATVKQTLASHLRNNHALTAAFKCKMCDFASKEKNELVKHIKMEHENCHIECEYCSFVTKARENLEVHIIVRHTKPQFPT